MSNKPATTQHSGNTQQIQRELYRVNDFAAAYGIGRSTVYELIKSGKIKPIRIAGRTLIPRTEGRRLIAEAQAA